MKPMNTTATKIANSSLGTATIITENLISEALMKVSVQRRRGEGFGKIAELVCIESPALTAGLSRCSHTGG